MNIEEEKNTSTITSSQASKLHQFETTTSQPTDRTNEQATDLLTVLKCRAASVAIFF